MGGRKIPPFLQFYSPPLEEGGVPEGRGGYSPLWNISPFFHSALRLPPFDFRLFFIPPSAFRLPPFLRNS